eukprot:187265_1
MRSINYLWCIKYNKNRLDGFNGGEEVDMVNRTIIISKTLIVELNINGVIIYVHIAANIPQKRQKKYLLHKLAASLERSTLNIAIHLLKHLFLQYIHDGIIKEIYTCYTTYWW